MAQRGRSSRSLMERYLPMGYFALSMVLVVTLLPTALRPPQDNPTTSAEFAPDAPPEDNPESILGNLERGRSGTAGSGRGDGAGQEETEELGPAVETPAPSPPPAACDFGIGGRQTPSVYSAPCAPAWEGDNGGRTYQGATRSEVRVAWFHGQQSASYEGPVPREEQENESANDRTLRVFQEYFNQAFQTFGRTFRLYNLDISADDSEQRAKAAKADEEWRVFAGAGVGAAACDEFARRELVNWCGGRPQRWFEDRPYRYSWWMDHTRNLAEFGVEYICKKLIDRPAEFAGDPTYQGEERVFGLFYPDVEDFQRARELFERRAREQCDLEIAEAVGYNLDSQQGQSAFATGVTEFRAAGVTTVITAADFVSSAAFTNAADAQGYYPEWFLPGWGALDRNQLAQLQNQREWQNAFGFAIDQMELRIQDMGCYSAYKRVDPANDPNYGICTWFFPTMLQMLNGIQLAGPNLTPQTYQKGLVDMGYRFYEDGPEWAIGGGFGPGDWTYMDDVVEIWWDPTAPDPQQGGQRSGSYQYVNCGKRFRLGEFTSELKVFDDGITAYEFPCD